jgi:hypothetical protein
LRLTQRQVLASGAWTQGRGDDGRGAGRTDPEQVAAVVERQREEQVSRLSPEELTARQQRRRDMLADGVA